MASTRRVSLFEREIHMRMSPAALELLFELAAVLSEGGVEGARFYGSTMATIDLGRAAPHISDTCDIATAKRVGELIGNDTRVRDLAIGLGIREAERLASARLVTPQIDLRVRQTGRHLHLDMDIEACTER